MFRCDAGVRADIPDGCHARFVVERLELRAGDDVRACGRDAEVGGDPRRGVRMVARDHQHANASGLRVDDGATDFRPRRIDYPDQAEVDELPLDRFVLRRRFVRWQRPVGDRERSHCEVAEPVDRREDLAPALLGKRAHTAAEALLGATGKQHVGSALRDDGEAGLALAVGVQRGHQLALGGERNLADALEPRAPSLGQPFHLRLRDQERGLGGITLDRPLAVDLPQHGVVREAPGCKHCANLVQQGRFVERTSVYPAGRRPGGSRCR